MTPRQLLWIALPLAVAVVALCAGAAYLMLSGPEPVWTTRSPKTLEDYDASLPRFGVPFYFGGTALLIVVGVSMDLMAQIEAHLLSRQYEGFVQGTRMRGRIG